MTDAVGATGTCALVLGDIISQRLWSTTYAHVGTTRVFRECPNSASARLALNLFDPTDGKCLTIKNDDGDLSLIAGDEALAMVYLNAVKPNGIGH